MRRLVLLAASTIGALLIATPAAAKPVTTVLYQDDYSTLTSTVYGNQQAVNLSSTLPSPEEGWPVFDFLVDGNQVFIHPGQTVILPRHADAIYNANSYPSLLLNQEADACVTNTGICVHGEYGPSDIGNQCDVYVENPTDATVTVTLYDSDGVALGSFPAGPGSTLVTTFDSAQCPVSASVG